MRDTVLVGEEEGVFIQRYHMRLLKPTVYENIFHRRLTPSASVNAPFTLVVGLSQPPVQTNYHRRLA